MSLASVQNVKKEIIGQTSCLNFYKDDSQETASRVCSHLGKQDSTNVSATPPAATVRITCRATESSSAAQGNTALDVSSGQDIIVTPETPAIISAGIHGLLPQGTVGLLLGRLGLTSQEVQIHTRVTDSDYRGELKVVVSPLFLEAF